MSEGGRLTIGAAIGAIAVAVAAPLLRPFFSPPTGGIGFVTVNAYPKSYDYALVALLVAGTFTGAAIAAAFGKKLGLKLAGTPAPRRAVVITASVAVFLLMLFAHDHPYVLMDPFHEGEHLTPAFLLRSGERPYKDVFFLHGLAADGGLDAMVLGEPPSPSRSRKLETVLDAAALAVLVPLAAELCTTPMGSFVAVFASLCGVAAGQLPVFPYYRLMPVLLAALGLLRYVRSGRPGALLLAFAASTVGLLWSLDTGSYALVATVVTFVVLRVTRSEPSPILPRKLLPVVAIAAALPLVILLAVRADIAQFAIDSFVTIPRSIDAVWALPAPAAPKLRELWRWLDSESARFYLPPIIYGLLLPMAWRLRRNGENAAAARVFIIAIASLLVFRTAVGRCAWSHTRYGVPLLGLAVVAFMIEPLWLARRRAAAAGVMICLAVLLEFKANTLTGAKLIAEWRRRQSHSDLVAYPFATGKGIYTTRENASELAALNGFIESAATPGATILDFSGERALYYLLQRKPPVRCPDIPMLSAPVLGAEAMRQLRQNPPACVVVKGIEALGSFDGVPNAVRVPELARWIDSRYPRRVQIGRFVVATP
jgi:hypothetical protein